MKHVVTVLLILSVLGATASAVPSEYTNLYGFVGLSNNSAVDTAIGESQLFVDVYTEGDMAYFKFYNEVGEQCSLTDVYFDIPDGLLDVTSSDIVGSDGVKFSAPANPPVLPGGEGISFTVDFSADSDQPPTQNGVDSADEWLIIGLQLGEGVSFDDVLAALESGELRIGLRLQGFESGGSESFVNNPTPVPEPASVCLLAFGALAGLATLKRRGKKKAV